MEYIYNTYNKSDIDSYYDIVDELDSSYYTKENLIGVIDTSHYDEDEDYQSYFEYLFENDIAS